MFTSLSAVYFVKIMDILENVSFWKTYLWLGIGSLLIYFWKSIYDKYRAFMAMNAFDGPKRDVSLIFGHLNLFCQSPDKLAVSLRNIARKYYPHYAMRIFHDVAIGILSPEDCELFLSNRKHSSKSNVYIILKYWLKEGLLLSKGDKWLTRRRILTPAFHFNILKDFVHIFNEYTEKLVETISNNCEEPIDIVPLITESTLHIISETAMGFKLDPNNDLQKGYRDALENVGKIFIHRLMRPWLFQPILYLFSATFREEKRQVNELHKFTRSIINERLKCFKGIPDFENEQTADENDVYMSRKKKRLAMLDILLAAHLNGEISYDGICEEVDTFLFEGHDTTSVAICYALMLLANNPEIQEQVHQEIKSVLGEEIRRPNYNDLQQMDLLERCIKETLRLYPSVHFISRLVDEDTVLHSGLVVPKNCKVHIFIADLHLNSELYPDPLKFDPDRFLPDNCQNRHPYAYIPFSAGPRNCIGQRFAILELKAVIVGIMQHFVLKPIDTPDSIVITLELVLRTKYGIKMKLEPRYC